MRGRFAILILLALGVAACGAPPPKATPTPSATQPSVTAKGEIVPARYAQLSFETSGSLTQLKAQAGMTVKAGDVLAQLDTQDLEFQVKTAQDALAVAQATLAQAQVPASAEEIASAQAAYDSAVAALAKAQQGPTADDLKILKANLQKAKASLDQAQAAYDQAGGASNPYVGMLPTSVALQSATQDYEIALANYNKSLAPDQTAIAQAADAVTQAEATLNLKKKSPRPEDVAVAQAGVQQAQTALDRAKAALPRATLVAPFDGTVTDVKANADEMVQAGAPLVTLADLSQLRVETTDLDEFGAAQVKPGQPVKVTVNALNDRPLTGTVSTIGLQSVTLATGDISYVVTVALDNQDPALRWGMTVKVDFGPPQQ